MMAMGIYFLGFEVSRADFLWVLGLYSGLFGLMGFWYFYSAKEIVNWKLIFLLGIVLRLLLLPSIPLWSEDFARFLWDGELLNLGFNPYTHSPRQWIQLHSEQSSAYLEMLYGKMNSPDYYSVYTPLNQFFFWFGAKLGGGSLISGLLVIRSILIVGEVLVFFILKSLLSQWGMDLRKLILYWLNPFLLFEVVGNLHFEGLVLLLLLCSLLNLGKNYTGLSGLFWGLAIGLKLVPLILTPGFLRLGSGQIRFFGSAAILIIFLIFPLLKDQSWIHLSQSVALYQGKFEFNASVYYLAREIGYWIEGYNTIAYLTKGLSVLTVLLILTLVFKKRLNSTSDWVELWVGCYWIYLLLQPIVHPWYLIPGIGLSILTKKVGFLVWSWAIIFSYQAYGNQNYLEDPILLFVEYGLVCLGLIYDYRRHYFTLPLQFVKK